MNEFYKPVMYIKYKVAPKGQFSVPVGMVPTVLLAVSKTRMKNSIAYYISYIQMCHFYLHY